MGDNSPTNDQQRHHQVVVSRAVSRSDRGASGRLSEDDDDIKPTGNILTATAHILTTVVDSEVLALAWATTQFGWIFGPGLIIFFSITIYCITNLLARSYPATGKHYTYPAIVQSNLGGINGGICALFQILNLFSLLIKGTIEASTSLTAIKWLSCYHESFDEEKCRNLSTNPYIIMFGATQLIFSQIRNFGQLTRLSVVATVMAITYSSIGTALAIAKVVENGKVEGSLFGVLPDVQEIGSILSALGSMAVAYSYSLVVIEIQGTLKTPPSAVKTMKKANFLSVIVATVVYLYCGCAGYAAFGKKTPDNIVTGFGYHRQYWLLDIANVAIVINSIGSYQIYSQPIFSMVEKWAVQKWPNSTFITKEIKVRIRLFHLCNLNLFRLVWRSAFVVLITLIPLLFPFIRGIYSFIAIISFCLLTVYFPVEMYIARNQIPIWSTKWIAIRILSLIFLLGSLVVAASTLLDIFIDFIEYKNYHPFTTYWSF